MPPPVNGETWSLAEVVRYLKRLDDGQQQLREEVSGGQRGLSDKLDALRAEYVPRELWRERNVHVDRRLDGFAISIVDLEANAARHEKWHQQTSTSSWRYWVSHVLSAAGGGLVAWLGVLLNR